MKYFYLILFLLLASFTFAQPSMVGPIKSITGFPDALITGESRIGEENAVTTVPKCGIFTYNPRIEGDYYCVDIYVWRPAETEWFTSTVNFCGTEETWPSNGLGGFAVVFDNIEPVYFNKKFDSTDERFIPEPDLLKNESATCLAPVKLSGEEYTAASNMQLSYDMNEVRKTTPRFISVGDDIPLKIGYFKLKIKDKTAKSGMALLKTGCAASAYSSSADEVSYPSGYVVTGWLDGVDPNIPLIPSGGTKPANPAPITGNALLCMNSTEVYTIGSLPKNADDCDWVILKGGNPIAPGDCDITRNKASVTIKWKAEGNYSITVKAKNTATSETSDNSSTLNVNVKALPTVKLLRDAIAITTDAQRTACSNVDINLSVTNVSGVTYAWTGGATGQTYNGKTENKTNNPISNKKFKVTASKTESTLTCSASDSVLMTINPEPVYVFNQTTTSYPTGQEITRSLTEKTGGPLEAWNWTSPVPPAPSAEQSITFNVVKGANLVAVTATNNKKCSATFTQNITGTGDGLQINLAVPSTQICNGGVVVLQAAVSGGSVGTDADGSCKYEWFAGATATGTPVYTQTSVSNTAYYSVNTAGTYTVKVTDPGSLSGTKTSPAITTTSKQADGIEVISPLVSGWNERTILSAKSTGTGNYTWLWTPAEDLNGAAEATKQYALTGRLTANRDFAVYMTSGTGCTTKGNVSVKIPTDNFAVTVNPTNYTICKGGTLQLNAVVTGGTGTVTYLWTPIGSASGLSPDNTGTPKFTASTSNVGVNNFMVKVTKGTQTAMANVSITVENTDAPKLTPGKDIYCVDSTFAITNTGGAANTYTWIVAKDGGTPVVSANAGLNRVFTTIGSYDVKIIGIVDGKCVSDTLRKTIVVKKPTLSQTLSALTYEGGRPISSTATAANGWENYIYTWTSPGPRTSAITNGPDTYSITSATEDSYKFSVSVKDEKGCKATTPDAAATRSGGLGVQLALASGTKYCTGGGVILQATISGGVGPYTCTWMKADNTPLASGTAQTYHISSPEASYQLKVEDASSPAFTVTKSINIGTVTGAAPVVKTAGTVVIKPNSTAALCADFVTPTTQPYTWQWSPADNKVLAVAEAVKQYAQTMSLTASQAYSVYVKDANGCISNAAKQQVNVDTDGSGNAFTIALNAATPMCSGGSQTVSVTSSVNAADLTYEWSSIPTNLFAGKNTQPTPEITVPSVTSTTSYTLVVKVTNTKTGAVNTAKKEMNVTTDQLPVLTLNYNACQGDTVRVTSSLTITGDYTWYLDGAVQANKGNKFPVPVDGNHTIKVTATAQNGCSGTNSGIYTIKAQPVLAWTPVLKDEIEIDETLIATVTATPEASYTYTWTKPKSGSGNTNTVTAKASDTDFKFEVYAMNTVTNCKSNILRDTLKVAAAALTPHIELLSKACINGSAVLDVVSVDGGSGPYTYSWANKTAEGTPIASGKQLVIAAGTSTQTYKVTVKNALGKTGYAEYTVTPESGTIPTLACIDQTIKKGTQAVLMATAGGTGPFTWNWSPVDSLDNVSAAGQQNPMTKALYTDNIFKVFVTNTAGCHSLEGRSHIHVTDNASQAFEVNIVPDVKLCIGNKPTYTAQIKGGSGAVTSCVWSATKGIAAKSDLIHAVYDAKSAGNDTITVVVEKGGVKVVAKKAVTVENNVAPILEFANAVSCSDSILIVRTKNNISLNGTYNWKITKDGVEQPDANSDRYKFTVGKWQVKITATGSNACLADTLGLDKEIDIYANPAISAIQIIDDCGEAMVAAVSTNAKSWTWVSTGNINGHVKTGSDSIYCFTAPQNQMSETFAGTVIATNAQGCKSAVKTFNSTVYSKPAITVNPTSLNVQRDAQPSIAATIAQNLSYQITWRPTDSIASYSADQKTIQTVKMQQSAKFRVIAANTAKASCLDSAVCMVNVVTGEDFKVEFKGLNDTLDLCGLNAAHTFVVEPLNNLTNVSYTFKMVSPSGVPNVNGPVTATNQTYTFNDLGEWKLSVVAKDATNAERYDTVVVRVNPNPVMTIDNLEGTYRLCENGGQYEIPMHPTAGTADWTLYYRQDNVAKTELIKQNPHKMVLTTGGEYWVDSVKDSRGCVQKYERSGWGIVDDIPAFASSMTNAVVCQGTSSDLGVEITISRAEDYPIVMHYQKGFTKGQTFSFADKNVKFSVNDAGLNPATSGCEYILDSITSAKGCTFKPASPISVTLKNYPESVPVLTITDKSDRNYCDNSTIDIPVSVTGGKSEYKISYTLGGVAGEKILAAAGNGNITIGENGPLIITGFADGNGCGTYTADQIKISKYETPTMEIVTTDRFICGGALSLDITLAKGTAPYTVYYAVDGGSVTTTVLTPDAAKKAVWNITTGGTYVINKVTDQHCEIPGTAVVNGPTIAIEAAPLKVKMKSTADICATSGAKIDLDFTGTDWTKATGKIRVIYNFVPVVGVAQNGLSVEATKVDAQNGNLKIPVNADGEYTLVSVVDLKGGTTTASGCAGSVSSVASENSVNTIEAPTVEIDSTHDFALYKGDTFVLGVKGPDANKFEYAWKIGETGLFNKVSAPYTINGTMVDKDLMYILKGTNKVSTSCYSTDTVDIYRIPDAPELAIDTNTNRYNLKLTWKAPANPAMVDGYSLKHVLSDPYSIKKAYTELPLSGGGKNTTSYALATTDLDTLEFFYMTANRKVNGKTYMSYSSDTVGYYKLDLHVNSNTKLGSNNLVPVFFDFVKMGLPTSKELLMLNIAAIRYVDRYEYATQQWVHSRLMGSTTLNPFDMKCGMLLQLYMNQSCTFIQYGELPSKWSVNISNAKTNSGGNANMTYMRPQRIDILDASVLFKEIPDLGYISRWDFATQQWVHARMMGTTNCLNNFKMNKALIPLMIRLKSDIADTVWE